MFNESKEHLKSISAYDYMAKAARFADDLRVLVNRQELSAAVLTGVLNGEIHRLNSEYENKAIAASFLEITKELGDMRTALAYLKKYADETFIKKEK